MQYFKAVYDISVLLGKENAIYPGDMPYSRETASAIASGANCNLSNLMLCAHSGTHIDCPAHFIEGTKTIEAYPVERFILPAQVVSIDDCDSITQENMKEVNIQKGEALLFRTQNSILGLSRNGVFSEKFVYLSEDAAKLCVDLGASLVGIDYISIDKYGDDAPVHRRLLEKDILILEGIDLRSVPPGRYTLIALPLRIKDVEAAPARAILLK